MTTGHVKDWHAIYIFWRQPLVPFELARLLARSFPITFKLIYKQYSDSRISLMMLKRL